jgi:hypothetical protein
MIGSWDEKIQKGIGVRKEFYGDPGYGLETDLAAKGVCNLQG